MLRPTHTSRGHRRPDLAPAQLVGRFGHCRFAFHPHRISVDSSILKAFRCTRCSARQGPEWPSIVSPEKVNIALENPRASPEPHQRLVWFNLFIASRAWSRQRRDQNSCTGLLPFLHCLRFHRDTAQDQPGRNLQARMDSHIHLRLPH
jgi:hypothetical protein